MAMRHRYEPKKHRGIRALTADHVVDSLLPLDVGLCVLLCSFAVLERFTTLTSHYRLLGTSVQHKNTRIDTPTPVTPRLADVEADDALKNFGGSHDGIVRICQEGVHDVLPWKAGALLEPYLVSERNGDDSVPEK